MSHYGVTASRGGPTLAQMVTLERMIAGIIKIGPLFELTDPGKPWLHHGDCVDGDAAAHDIARIHGFRIHGHPPTDSSQRAFRKCDVMEEPLPYLERNREIVNVVGRLWVMPATDYEQIRSGTWSTWRYAKSIGRRWDMILPDGTVKSG